MDADLLRLWTKASDMSYLPKRDFDKNTTVLVWDNTLSFVVMV